MLARLMDMRRVETSVKHLTATSVQPAPDVRRTPALLREYERLDEEVRQLRAAVKLYAEIARRRGISVPVS